MLASPMTPMFILVSVSFSKAGLLRSLLCSCWEAVSTVTLQFAVFDVFSLHLLVL
jgi:hypothetical protein